MAYDLLEIVELAQANVKYILSFVIISNFLIIFLLKLSIKLREKFNRFSASLKDREVLLLTAHPDDEIMFFLPTLNFLIRKKVKVRLLCLSNGNADGLGRIREEELSKVCKKIGIEDCTVLNQENLQDDIKKKWDEENISQALSGYLKEGDKLNKIGALITFDELGVTKHPNHMSCGEALIKFLKDNKETVLSKGIISFMLDTHTPLSQYTLLVPYLIFYFKEFGFFNKSPFKAWSLMKMHRSQFTVWRKIHILLSSYTYCNTLTKIEFA